MGLAVVAAVPVSAQEPPPAVPEQAAPRTLPMAVAAVIDYQRVLREAQAAKSIRDQVDVRRKLFQDQIAKEEKRLVDTDKDLTKQRAVLSAEAFGQKRRDFEKKVSEVQRMVQERRRTLDQTSGAALNQVRNAIIEIVSGMADQRGFNIVLPSSGVLLFSPQIDLTQEVIAQLDETLPSVKVPERIAQQKP